MLLLSAFGGDEELVDKSKLFEGVYIIESGWSKNKKAYTQDRTRDLLITSEMRYHCAIQA